MTTTSDDTRQPTSRRTPVPYGSPTYNGIVDFLIREAWLLDDGEFEEWLALMAEDVEYFMPTRATVSRSDGAGFSESMGHFDETRDSLRLRVRRLTESANAWTESPPSRTRHLISNVTVDETDVVGEYAVRSALLLLRNRLHHSAFDTIPCTREDILRRVDGSFQLARRTILVDQSTLGTANLSMFF